MLKQKYFLTGIFILSAERQPIKLAWRKIVWLRDVKTNTFTIVPYARYFFLSSNVVRLFADGGFGFSTSKTKGNDALNSWNIGIKPGIAIKLSDHFCLVAKYGFLGYSKKENHGYESENVGIDFDTDELNFGFHYIF